jgi:glutamine synthetase
MHTNLSLSKGGKNIFYDAAGEDGLSPAAWDFIDRLLNNANDMCLLINSSVNAYRRLDPHFEAPNQIRSSAVDRTSMVRIPLGNEKSARIEVRTVAPDANPYLTFLSILYTGLRGPKNEQQVTENRRSRTRVLPGNIYDAIRLCKSSEFVSEMLGELAKDKFIERKVAAADRCPRELGTNVKSGEVSRHTVLRVKECVRRLATAPACGCVEYAARRSTSRSRSSSSRPASPSRGSGPGSTPTSSPAGCASGS